MSETEERVWVCEVHRKLSQGASAGDVSGFGLRNPKPCYYCDGPPVCTALYDPALHIIKLFSLPHHRDMEVKSKEIKVTANGSTQPPALSHNLTTFVPFEQWTEALQDILPEGFTITGGSFTAGSLKIESEKI